MNTCVIREKKKKLWNDGTKIFVKISAQVVSSTLDTGDIFLKGKKKGTITVELTGIVNQIFSSSLLQRLRGPCKNG